MRPDQDYQIRNRPLYKGPFRSEITYPIACQIMHIFHFISLQLFLGNILIYYIHILSQKSYFISHFYFSYAVYKFQHPKDPSMTVYRLQNLENPRHVSSPL
jgi:hypothetical protein